MIEFLLFLCPSVLYILVRRKSIGVSRALAHVGWRWGSWQAAGLSLVLFPVLLGTGYLGIRLVSTASLTLPGVVLVHGVSGAAILRAVGEEIFFRGFLGGLFFRRWGLWVGNTLQAALFLVPHLVLLSIDVHLWPILPVQFLGGWILGVVRYRSGSVIECSVLHAAVNIGIGLLAG
ncbi:CPBP family intramembrane glutamic endopeptidase [uncultured Corynebacterium sp.]|uniref:CPBP family intramembrane glutamic endopeptidase n=1 Tax=Corynebacterium sp. LaCa116 TaxID=3391423 RepID=UPI0025FB006D|nr:CPBP family intramembrane glutamic endopeptidase [uncultured Corynebacterium sp.]